MSTASADPALNWIRFLGLVGGLGGHNEYEYGSDGSTDPSAASATEYTADPYAESLTEH